MTRESISFVRFITIDNYSLTILIDGLQPFNFELTLKMSRCQNPWCSGQSRCGNLILFSCRPVCFCATTLSDCILFDRSTKNISYDKSESDKRIHVVSYNRCTISMPIMPVVTWMRWHIPFPVYVYKKYVFHED